MHTKGLWINESTFINFASAETKKNLTEELATRKGAIDFYSLGMYLPNPDPILKKQGKDITVYKELLTDSHLGGCISSRKSGVLSLEWEIDKAKAKSRQAKTIQSILANLDLYQIISEILDAILFGYQVSEIIWKTDGSYLIPEKIVGKPQQWFCFDRDNNLRLKTKENYTEGIPVPPYKFLLTQHNATYDNPYGFPEISRCFWPITFKKGGIKFWVIFAEKYSMPYLIGKHPRGTAQTETDKLADLLENMVQDAIAVIPDDSSIEIMESSGKSASSDIYKTLIEYCDKQISITLLGQNLTTDVQGGSYAAAQSHMQVRQDFIESDKRLVENTINTLIKWIYELNFSLTPLEHSLPVFTMYEQEDVDKTLAERDKILVDAGVRFTPQYFKKTYGFTDEDLQDVQPQQQNFTEALKPSAYPDQKALDDAIDSLPPEKLQEQMEGVLKPIIDLINSYSPSYLRGGQGELAVPPLILRGGQGELSLQIYNTLMEKLIETYPDMDTKAIEDMLARAIFVSELWGRLSAKS